MQPTKSRDRTDRHGARDEQSVSGAGNRAYDAILLIGFGGPETPEEIRPFLDRVLKGRPVPRERYEEVVHHYEALGGRSPYNELTRQLAADLRIALRRRGLELPILIGLRNAAPSIDEAIAALARDGSRRVLGFILSAFRCAASWERYQNEVAQACVALGPAAPMIVYPDPWHREPRFIAAEADRVRDTMAQMNPPDAAAAELIFTAHSIPVAMDGRETYVRQLRESAALLARAVDRDSLRENWTMAFQRRRGRPRDLCALLIGIVVVKTGRLRFISAAGVRAICGSNTIFATRSSPTRSRKS
jgi:ferrochelatase